MIRKYLILVCYNLPNGKIEMPYGKIKIKIKLSIQYLITLRKYWLTRFTNDLARAQLWSIFWLGGCPIIVGVNHQVLTGQPRGQGHAAVDGIGAGRLPADRNVVAEAAVVTHVTAAVRPDMSSSSLGQTLLVVTIGLARAPTVRVQLATAVQTFLPQAVLASKFGLVLAIPAII